MAAEKVKYFTNTDVVCYLIAFIGIGAVIGHAFGVYKNMRYGLMIRRLDVLKNDFQSIDKRYQSLNANSTLQIIYEIKNLKGKSFDGGCAWQPGDYMFENIYRSTPTVMMSTNGFQVNMTNLTGTIKNIVDFTTNSSGIKINSIVPKNREFPVCWLVVPPADPLNN